MNLLKKMKKHTSVLFKVCLVFMMAFGCLFVKGIENVNAETGTLTKVGEIKYPATWDPDGNWSTGKYEYNGKIAYCINASKKSPADGNYVSSVINNNNLLKVLYYGYGGEGEQYAKDHGVAYANDDDAYLNTHIMASYAYSGDLYGLDVNTGAGAIIMGRYHAIINMPLPTSENMKIPNLTASYDADSGGQKTNEVTVEGESKGSAGFTLQEGVTAHFSDGTTATGNITLHGGDKFYLTADNTVSGDWTSNTASVSGLKRFEAIGISTGGTTQNIGSLVVTDPDEVTDFNVKWLDHGKLRLSKVSNTSDFQENSKFRLVSTSYEGFDKEFEVTKDASGDFELLIEDLPVGTYALTEVGVKEYFAPTVAQFTVEIKKDETTKKIVVNTLRPTGTLNLTKKLDNATEGVKDYSDKDITKTSYKIVAGDDIVDTVSLKKLYSKGDVVKVNSGKCVIDTADGNSMEYSKGVQVNTGTANDDGTINVDKDGNISVTGLPLGKYQVVENTCPDGYVLDQTPFEFSVTQKDYVTTVYETAHEQTNGVTKMVLHKQDITTSEELEGASMKVTDKDGNVVDEWVSGKDAHEIDGLTVGETYTLTEVIAPENYQLAQDVEFTVKNTAEQQHVVMYDELMPTASDKGVKTGDNTSIEGFKVLGIISMLLGGLLIAIGKKEVLE